tara:strand:- start:595 stop:1194 length:600 start_codon:yes stop_codon:yes gene_type:complete
MKTVTYDARFFNKKKLWIKDNSITDCIRIPKDKNIISQEVVNREEHGDVLISVCHDMFVHTDAKDIYDSIVNYFAKMDINKNLSNNITKIVWSYYTCIIDIGAVWNCINDPIPVSLINTEWNEHYEQKTITEEDIDSFANGEPIDSLKIVMASGDKYITMHMNDQNIDLTIKTWRVCKWKKRCPNIKCGCTNRHFLPMM